MPALSTPRRQRAPATTPCRWTAPTRAATEDASAPGPRGHPGVLLDAGRGVSRAGEDELAGDTAAVALAPDQVPDAGHKMPLIYQAGAGPASNAATPAKPDGLMPWLLQAGSRWRRPGGLWWSFRTLAAPRPARRAPTSTGAAAHRRRFCRGTVRSGGLMAWLLPVSGVSDLVPEHTHCTLRCSVCNTLMLALQCFQCRSCNAADAGPARSGATDMALAGRQNGC